MMRICVLSLFFVISIDNLIAQQCNVKEEINPLNDSLCWIIGTKDHLEFIVDKSVPGKNWINLTVVSPGRLSSSIGDSAWLLLDDNYIIKLSSSKNFKSATETLKALYVEIDYYYIRFLSEMKSDDIKRMITSKLKKIFFNLHPIFNLNYEISKVKKSPFIPKTSTYTLTENHVEVRINKVSQRQQKDILNTAVCADKYVQ